MSPNVLSALHARLDRLIQPIPAGFLLLYAESCQIGALAPDFAARVLRAHHGLFSPTSAGLRLDETCRGDRLTASWAALLAELRPEGWFGAWRDEAYDVRLEDASAGSAPLCRLERGVFRRFGLRSQAVHVNGVSADGRMWVARRAAHKAIDPDQLDNLVGGGVASGEHPASTLIREAAEEAGMAPSLARQALSSGVLHARRLEDEGVHDERLHVFTLALPAGFRPLNTDGEVAEFMLLEPAEVASRILAGEFTEDAAAVASTWLLAQAKQALNKFARPGFVRGDSS